MLRLFRTSLVKARDDVVHGPAIRYHRYSRVAFWGCMFLLGCMVFRPHGDTFTALDHSGYRMMAYALVEGRGFHEVDRVMMEAPREVRQALMLLPHMNERNTRDRSFMMANLDNPETEPFFYPLLPWLSAGLERLMPGFGLDLVAPLSGMVFFGALLWVGFRAGGAWGGFVTLVLLLGAPWPLWLFRGFYVEAVGAACLAAGIVLFYRSSHGLWPAVGAGLMAGLSVSFHPVFIVVALPVVVLVVLDPVRRWSDGLGALLGFAAGISILLAMTEWICRPYGDFSLSTVASNFRISASHRLPVVFAVASLCVLVAGLVARPWWSPQIKRFYAHPAFRLGVLAVAFVPVWYAGHYWVYAGLVRHGLLEGWGGIRWPLGALMLVGGLGVVASKQQGRAYAILLVFLLTLPVFAYLKGAEQMAMWSQRRLLPAYSLLVLAILPWLSSGLVGLAGLVQGRWGVLSRAVLVAGLAYAGLANPVRWPAPYFTRVEAGALEFVRDVKAVLGARLTVFDHHPYSFPFAVDNRTRAAGIGIGSLRDLGHVAAWLRDQAAGEEVVWASAYKNPGMEDGVFLDTWSQHAVRLAHVISKTALPAVERSMDVSLSLLRVRPATMIGPRPALDKIMDGGPLGLREPWGTYRRALRNEQGEMVPAEWSRQGSGLVGPVPTPGGVVTLTIWGQSGQDTAQTIHVHTPWGFDGVEMVIGPEYGAYEVQIHRTGDVREVEPLLTGVYRLQLPNPYNPSLSGIRGFADDLGVLVHRIRLACASTGDQGDASSFPEDLGE